MKLPSFTTIVIVLLLIVACYYGNLFFTRVSNEQKKALNDATSDLDKYVERKKLTKERDIVAEKKAKWEAEQARKQFEKKLSEKKKGDKAN